MWLRGLQNICTTSFVYIYISCHYNRDIYIVYCIVLYINFMYNESRGNEARYLNMCGIVEFGDKKSFKP